MKERPILFSTPMIQAILDGRKRMTRRVVKPQPTWSEPEEMDATTSEGWQTTGHSGRWWCACSAGDERNCPYGVPGDRLWVREAAWYDDEFGGRVFFVDTNEVRFKDGRTGGLTPHPITEESLAVTGSQVKRSGRYMPRWASRITLEVTAVRVERVQDIDEWGVRAEGLRRPDDGPNIVASFRRLWNDINERRGYGWDVNPWVWVVEFRRAGQEK